MKDQAITCVTTDPLVATIFAIECRSHGHAVILLGRIDEFDDLRGPDNHGALLESAVNLLLPPEEFAGKAAYHLDVDQSIEILVSMGFDRLPARIQGVGARRIALEETYSRSQRLTLAQIGAFNRFVIGEEK